jgi:large subunit ribosomal protein L3
MSIGILGQKVGMTQLYLDGGEVIPVTVIQAGPCHVLQVKTKEKDGYEAVQLGFSDKPRKLAPRSQRGHVAKLDSKRQRSLAATGLEPGPKAGCEPKRFVREFRVPSSEYEVGQVIDVSALEEMVAVDITATCKGRGYSGAMKRHNFSGQRASHGVKKCHRHLGGTGCSAYPSRTIKGKKMPGQYGNKRTTIRNQKIVSVDPENHVLVIRGAIPGPNGGFVSIRPTNRLPQPKANPWRIAK